MFLNTRHLSLQDGCAGPLPESLDMDDRRTRLINVERVLIEGQATGDRHEST